MRPGGIDCSELKNLDGGALHGFDWGCEAYWTILYTGKTCPIV